MGVPTSPCTPMEPQNLCTGVPVTPCTPMEPQNPHMGVPTSTALHPNVGEPHYPHGCPPITLHPNGAPSSTHGRPHIHHPAPQQDLSIQRTQPDPKPCAHAANPPSRAWRGRKTPPPKGKKGTQAPTWAVIPHQKLE